MPPGIRAACKNNYDNLFQATRVLREFRIALTPNGTSSKAPAMIVEGSGTALPPSKETSSTKTNEYGYIFGFTNPFRRAKSMVRDDPVHEPLKLKSLRVLSSTAVRLNENTVPPTVTDEGVSMPVNVAWLKPILTVLIVTALSNVNVMVGSLKIQPTHSYALFAA